MKDVRAHTVVYAPKQLQGLAPACRSMPTNIPPALAAILIIKQTCRTADAFFVAVFVCLLVCCSCGCCCCYIRMSRSAARRCCGHNLRLREQAQLSVEPQLSQIKSKSFSVLVAEKLSCNLPTAHHLHPTFLSARNTDK